MNIEITTIRPTLAAMIDAPRSFTVTPDTSYLRGRRETVFKLRCYGRGIGIVGQGNPNTLGSRAVADAYGEAWVKSGLSPCHVDQARLSATPATGSAA